jgi:tRNA pseudouridine55 synthase
MPPETVDGVLLLDKPRGMTSNAALQVVKRLMGAKKAGHTGTLDPMASGLLPLCFGEATKFAGVLLDAHKTYAAELQLGVTTTTGDAEGEIVERRSVSVAEDRVRAEMAGFVGAYDQIPPAHSALKHRGRPLYEYARAGIEAPRVARRVEIFALTCEGMLGDRVRFVVTCSKGTYIRSLAEDIGRRLDCGAHLCALRRLASGAFQLSDGVSLAALVDAPMEWRRGCLLAADAPLAALPALVVAPDEFQRVRQGQRFAAPEGTRAGLVRMYAEGGRFIGLGEVTGDGFVAPRRLVAKEALGCDARAPADAHG